MVLVYELVLDKPRGKGLESNICKSEDCIKSLALAARDVYEIKSGGLDFEQYPKTGGLLLEFGRNCLNYNIYIVTSKI